MCVLIEQTPEQVAEWDRQVAEAERACAKANRTGQPVDFGDNMRAWAGLAARSSPMPSRASSGASAAHLEQLEALAARKGFTLDTAGLHHGRKLIAKSEEEIYATLGLPFIEPELREGTDEIALAMKHALPKLVTDHDLHGILHAHTDLSDGVDTLEVMAEATRARGYQYFGVADHSKSAHYAGGLSVEEIDAQHAEINLLNKRYGKSFRILNVFWRLFGPSLPRRSRLF